jgi:hypothetical protein
MKSAEELFESELRRLGIAFSHDTGTGLYRLESAAGALAVSLDNVRRDLARDGDASAVGRFVARVLRAVEIPAWETARSRIFFSAEPGDQQFGETLREDLTETLSKVLVYCDEDEGTVTWLSPSNLRAWGVDRQTVEATACENLGGLLRDRALEVEEIDGTKLGLVPVDSVFKASLIFAPAFKAFVSPELGWPVLVVIPCRDFIYVLAEADADFLPRLGSTVQREFRQSGYPITTEVLRIADEGLEAIGKFPE